MDTSDSLILANGSLNENYKDKEAVEAAKRVIEEEHELTKKLEKEEKERKEAEDRKREAEKKKQEQKKKGQNQSINNNKQAKKDKADNIIITDEEKFPANDPQGYKRICWVTGKDGYTADPAGKEGYREKGSELRKAMKRGHRYGETGTTINLDNKIKEDTVTLIFVKEDNKEGIINTYNGKESPGKPERTSKKKHTTEKSKIIKQYWDETIHLKDEVETKRTYMHVDGDYGRVKVVKNIKIETMKKSL